MKQILLLFTVFMSFLDLQAQQNSRVIEGQVLDINDGLGIPGVSIIVKNTSLGTVTDAEGKFKLAVPEGVVLVITSVGYITQEIEIKNLNYFNITLMPDTTTLEEVIVVGYAEQAQQALTGSVSGVHVKKKRKKEKKDINHPSIQEIIWMKVMTISKKVVFSILPRPLYQPFPLM